MEFVRMKNSKTQKRSFESNRLLIRILLFMIILGGALTAGILAFVITNKVVLASFSSPAGGGPRFQSSSQQATQSPGSQPEQEAPDNPSAPVIEPTLAAWDGAGRVTILLLGLDYRDWEAGSGASRSDTMILLTLDPLTKTAGILSIPRDMWVSIPGFKHGKINTAYYLGDAYKLPGGGPGLAVTTVEQFLGVPINYYAQIDFQAFIRFIDEIGGVKIDVPEKITIDPLGDNNTKTLKPGVQTLPGYLALAYARDRHTRGGDFDRAARQQQVILGIRDRILDFKMLPTLISKAPVLYKELASGVHTNLALDEVIKLATLASQVPEGNIRQGVIGSKYVIFGRSPDNLSILIPIPDKVHVLRDEIFATSGAMSPLTTGTDQEKMQAEGASVSILDGSGAAGLAGRTGDYLRSLGVNVTNVSDAGERATVTTIVIYTGKPYVSKYLVDLMKISPYKIVSSYDPTSSVDVEVTLGSDWARSNPMQ
jgi:LCP family protein required for cell wall assembly